MVKKIINEFIEAKLKKEKNIIFFGSALESDLFSDIDLLVLSDKNVPYSKEQFPFKDAVFEVFSISKNNIFEIIEMDKPYGVIISIISNGEIIIDDNHFISDIKELIRSKQIKVNSFLKKNLIENRIHQNLKKISFSEDYYQKDLLINEINSDLIELRLLEFGVGEAKKSNFKYEKIKYHDYTFLKFCIDTKKAFLNNGSFENYINTLEGRLPIRAIIDRKHYSNNFFLNEVYNDELIVYIKTNKKDLKKNQALYSKALNKIEFENYFFYEIQEGRIYESGLYLAIYEESEKLKSKIIPELNSLHNESSTFPYQLEMSSALGIYPKSEFNNCKSFLIEIYQLISQKEIAENQLPLLFMNLYIGSYIKTGLSVEYFEKRFWAMLENFEQLFKNKNQNISMFQEDIYKKQKDKFFKEKIYISENVVDAYCKVIKKWDVNFLPAHSINDTLNQMDFNIIYKHQLYIEYNFLNLIFDVFMFNNSHRLYIFHVIASFLNRENEL